jgi:Tfp pilus assembly protein FimV
MVSEPQRAELIRHTDTQPVKERTMRNRHAVNGTFRRLHLVAPILLLAVALAAPAFAASADPTAPTPRDQAFVASLAQPTSSQTCQLSANPIVTAPAVTCIHVGCDNNLNCANCPGGESAWYCAKVGFNGYCTPY